MHTAIPSQVVSKPDPWNKGRLIGQKSPLKPKDVWAIRARLQLERRARDLALFNLAIDSKLRGYDLVRLMVEDVCAGRAGHDRSEKDRATGPVRDHRTDPRINSGPACHTRSLRSRVPFPEPLPHAATPLDPTIRADRSRLGRERGT